MADDTQTPDENEATPQTPQGTGNEAESVIPGIVIAPEEEEDFRQFQEIKNTVGVTKFSESANEAIRLRNELQRANEALTERELSANIPDYNDLTDAEKENRKMQIKNQNDILEMKAKEKWREDYANLSPELKELISKKGGEKTFKDFACAPSRAKADLVTVAQSFVFDIVRGQTPKVAPKPGIEAAGSSNPQPSKPAGGYTTVEAARIRQTNPALYSKLVKENRMKIVD